MWGDGTIGRFLAAPPPSLDVEPTFTHTA